MVKDRFRRRCRQTVVLFSMRKIACNPRVTLSWSERAYKIIGKKNNQLSFGDTRFIIYFDAPDNASFYYWGKKQRVRKRVRHKRNQNVTSHTIFNSLSSGKHFHCDSLFLFLTLFLLVRYHIFCKFIQVPKVLFSIVLYSSF